MASNMIRFLVDDCNVYSKFYRPWVLYERLLGFQVSSMNTTSDHLCQQLPSKGNESISLAPTETNDTSFEFLSTDSFSRTDDDGGDNGHDDGIVIDSNKLLLSESIWFETQNSRIQTILEEIHHVEQKVKQLNERSEKLIHEIVCRFQERQIELDEKQHQEDHQDRLDDDEEEAPLSSLDIPCNILGTIVASYISHRPTFNSLGETCQELHTMCRQMTDPLPPWPETVLRTRRQNALWSVAFSPDHLLLVAGGNDGSIRVWHRQFGVLDGIYQAHFGRIYSIVFDSRSRYMASASADGAVKLWNYAKAIERIHRRANPEAAGSDNTTMQDQADDDEEIWTFSNMETTRGAHPHTHVNCLVFNSSGDILASSGDGTVRLWNVQTRTCLAALREDDVRVVESVSFSPDTKTLAAGNWGNKVTLWDIETQTVVGSTREGRCVHSVCFSPILQHIASSRIVDESNKEYRLCSATDHNHLKVWTLVDDDDLTSNVRRNTIQRQQQQQYTTSYTTLEGHNDSVWSVIFSSDGKFIASGSEDGTCRVWNVSNGRCVKILHQSRSNSYCDNEMESTDQHPSYINDFDDGISSVYSVAFSPCNGYVAAARHDGTIEIRQLSK